MLATEVFKRKFAFALQALDVIETFSTEVRVRLHLTFTQLTTLRPGRLHVAVSPQPDQGFVFRQSLHAVSRHVARHGG